MEMKDGGILKTETTQINAGAVPRPTAVTSMEAMNLYNSETVLSWWLSKTRVNKTERMKKAIHAIWKFG